MTVKELREALAPLSDEMEVRTHDSDYGSRPIGAVVVQYVLVPDRRYMWTYDTEEEAREMADERETVRAIYELRR